MTVLKHKPTIRAESVAAVRRQLGKSVSIDEALCRLINRGSFHGGDLPLLTAVADSVARCETVIRRAAAAGLITRGIYQPSREQRFFGIGGFVGDALVMLDEMHRSTLCHHWITATTKWLKPADIAAAVTP